MSLSLLGDVETCVCCYVLNSNHFNWHFNFLYCSMVLGIVVRWSNGYEISNFVFNILHFPYPGVHVLFDIPVSQ